MRQSILSLLADLSEAIENEEFENAQSIANDLQDAYDAKQDEDLERTNKARAMLADPETASIENLDTIGGLTRLDGSTRMTRTMLVLMVAALAESHEKLETEGELDSVVTTVKAAIEELQAAESELSTAVTEADKMIEKSTVPPTLVVNSTTIESTPVRTNEEISVSVTITNAGDEPANSGNLVFAPTKYVTVEPDIVSIETLNPGESLTREVQASSSNEGFHAINIEVTAENANPDLKTIILPVTGKNSKSTIKSTSGSQETPGESGPGFGVGTAITALSSGAYALARRLPSSDE